MHGFESIQQSPGAGFAGPDQQRTAILVVTAGQFAEVVLQLVEVMNVHATRSREIALRREIRTFVVIDACNQLRDHEIEIGIALPVGVRAHIDGHARDVGREIGPVVEIEAAQEILVRFAGAAVLRDDHARNVFQNLAGAQQRPIVDQLRCYDTCAGRIHGPDCIFVVADHFHGIQHLNAVGPGDAH